MSGNSGEHLRFKRALNREVCDWGISKLPIHAGPRNLAFYGVNSCSPFHSRLAASFLSGAAYLFVKAHPLPNRHDLSFNGI